MAENNSSILFYEEKKEIVTNILDAAVKNLGLEQAAYLKLKANLLDEIELAGNEKLGLNRVVTLVNERVTEEIGNSGMVIVDSKPKEALGDDKNESDKNSPRAAASISYSNKETEKRPSHADSGKERLLRLLEFLSPYFTQKELEIYKAKLRTLKLGGRTDSLNPRTTGDVEYEIILNVRQQLGDQFDEMVKQSPSAFIDEYESAAGVLKKENVAPNLKKQIQTVVTISEFLSLKDLIGRHMKEADNERDKDKTLAGKLMFWKR